LTCITTISPDAMPLPAIARMFTKVSHHHRDAPGVRMIDYELPQAFRLLWASGAIAEERIQGRKMT